MYQLTADQAAARDRAHDALSASAAMMPATDAFDTAVAPLDPLGQSGNLSLIHILNAQVLEQARSAYRTGDFAAAAQLFSAAKEGDQPWGCLLYTSGPGRPGAHRSPRKK